MRTRSEPTESAAERSPQREPRVTFCRRLTALFGFCSLLSGVCRAPRGFGARGWRRTRDEWFAVSVFERAALLGARDGNDELRAARDAVEHLLQGGVVNRRVVNVARFQLVAESRDGVRAAVVHVRVDVEHARLDDERVVVDVEFKRRVECDRQRARRVLGGLDALARDGKRASGDDLLGEVVEVWEKHPDAAVRDQISEVARPRRLMNQVRVAERNLQLADGVSRVARLDDFAGAHALVRADPVGRGRNPRRVPDDLTRLALADVDRILLHADADRVRLHLLAVLPERQAERRHVERELDVGPARLELRPFDVAAGFSVLALRLEAVVADEALLLTRYAACRARREQNERERRRLKNPTRKHECLSPSLTKIPAPFREGEMRAVLQTLRGGGWGSLLLSNEMAARRKRRVVESKATRGRSEADDVEVEQRGLHDADEEADGEAEQLDGSEVLLRDREHEVFELRDRVARNLLAHDAA